MRRQGGAGRFYIRAPTAVALTRDKEKKKQWFPPNFKEFG